MKELKEWLIKEKEDSNIYKGDSFCDGQYIAYQNTIEKIEELEEKKCVWKVVDFKEDNINGNLYQHKANCGDGLVLLQRKADTLKFCPFCGLQIECEELKNGC